MIFSLLGDGIEDANIEETVANAVILKLYELKQWVEDAILHPRILKDGENAAQVREAEGSRAAGASQRTGPKGFWDEIFENELNALAKEAINNYNGYFLTYCSSRTLLTSLGLSTRPL